MLEQNEYFDLFVKDRKVILHLKKSGYSMKDLDLLVQQHPRIEVGSFMALRQALTVVGQNHEIGKYVPTYQIIVSQDKMKAELYINVTQEEFDENREKYIAEIKETVAKSNVTHGIQEIPENVQVKEPLIIAQGQAPVRGANAIVRYIPKPERRPVIREDGSADLYEMNFVTPIEQGGWLGEKEKAKQGTPGFNVYGEPIAALNGEDIALYYDKKTVEEVEEEDKIVLRAIHGGALQWKNGVVSVDKQLVVQGDVGPETGSLKFDGSIVIRGTVLASYSVVATGDISIEGRDSVSNAKEIRSTQGSIYIKGGVFGANRTIIEAAEALYIKHSNNGKLKGKEVHIGSYLLGSTVEAEKVFIDRNKGKVIGGHIRAREYIETAFAGNVHERMTHLEVYGIPKDKLRRESQKMAEQLSEEQKACKRLEEQLLKVKPHASRLVGQQLAAFEKLEQEVQKKVRVISQLERSIYNNLQMMKIRLKPRIEVVREAHPGVIIQIEGKSSTIHSPTQGVFEIVGDTLNV